VSFFSGLIHPDSFLVGTTRCGEEVDGEGGRMKRDEGGVCLGDGALKSSVLVGVRGWALAITNIDRLL